MLIIFDLDDTLIQTSAVITPWRFEKVLNFLEDKKALFEPSSHLLDKLIHEHQAFETSGLALENLFEKHKIDKKYFDECLAILNRFDAEMPVCVFEGVYDILKHLKSHGTLVCVTSGSKDIQTLKLEKTGLHKDYFEEIVIVETGDKHEAYKELFQKYQIPSAIVIGDRIKKDLYPAKKLGISTALVKQGRGQYQKIIEDLVDFVIQDVTEVPNLIKSIQNP